MNNGFDVWSATSAADSYFSGLPIASIEEKWPQAAQTIFSPESFRPDAKDRPAPFDDKDDFGLSVINPLWPALSTDLYRNDPYSRVPLKDIRGVFDLPPEAVMNDPRTGGLLSMWNSDSLKISMTQREEWMRIRLAAAHNLWNNRERFFPVKGRSGRSLFMDIILWHRSIFSPFIFTADEWRRWGGGEAALQPCTREGDLVIDLVMNLLNNCLHDGMIREIPFPFLTPFDFMRSVLEVRGHEKLLPLPVLAATSSRSSQKPDPGMFLSRRFFAPFRKFNIMMKMRCDITAADLAGIDIPVCVRGKRVVRLRPIDMMSVTFEMEHIARVKLIGLLGKTEMFRIITLPAAKGLLSEPIWSVTSAGRRVPGPGETLLGLLCAAAEKMPLPYLQSGSNVMVIKAMSDRIERQARKDLSLRKEVLRLAGQVGPGAMLILEKAARLTEVSEAAGSEWVEDYQEGPPGP